MRDLHDTIGNVILADHNWRGQLAARSPRAYINAVLGTVNYLRDVTSPLN